VLCGGDGGRRACGGGGEIDRRVRWAERVFGGGGS